MSVFRTASAVRSYGRTKNRLGLKTRAFLLPGKSRSNSSTFFRYLYGSKYLSLTGSSFFLVNIMDTEYKCSPADIEQAVIRPEKMPEEVEHLVSSSVIFETTPERMTISFPVKVLQERIARERVDAFFDGVKDYVIRQTQKLCRT